MLRFRLIACGIFGLFAAVFPARAQLAMENGFLLPPYDTLYALVVFAEVDYSERCPGNLGEPWISDWVQGPGGTQPPPQAPQLFSSAPDLENPGLATMFYEQAYAIWRTTRCRPVQWRSASIILHIQLRTIFQKH